jgi:hypothetical protein
MAEQLEPHCGTAFCVAGYVGQMHDERYATREVVDGKHVSVFAAEQLGIDTSTHVNGLSERHPMSHPLFAGSNSATMVRHYAEELAGGPL